MSTRTFRIVNEKGLHARASAKFVEVVEEVLGGLVTGHPAGSDVLVDLAFAFLPALAPEPALVRGHRQRRAQFDHAVVPFNHLDDALRLHLQL